MPGVSISFWPYCTTTVPPARAKSSRRRAFVTNDDIIVARFDLSSTATPGQINTIISGIALSGNWNASDALAIYWYPTLGTNATVPGAGTSYGFYRDPVANGGTGTGTDGSDAWFTPADGNLINIYFFTGDAGSCCKY